MKAFPIGLLFLILIMTSCQSKQSWFMDLRQTEGICISVKSQQDFSEAEYQKGSCPSGYAYTCQLKEILNKEQVPITYYFYKIDDLPESNLSEWEEFCRGVKGKGAKND